MREFKRVPYNEDVVRTLDMLKARAEDGLVNFLAFVICEGGGHGEDGYVGDMAAYNTAYYGLHHCAKRIMDSGDRHAAPPQNLTPPANMWRYDVSVEPMCFDFIAWLVTIKMIQARECVGGPTHVCFVRKIAQSEAVDEEARSNFYKSVCVPALDLFDCVLDPEAKNGRTYPAYSYLEITEAAHDGESVPRIRVPSEALAGIRAGLGGKEPVVITLREHVQWDHRNSDLEAWLKFAGYLRDRGEKVLFVRDYSQDAPLEGFETVPEASKNLVVRAALYESAKCNLFVSNGPQSLALFGSRPWLMFVDCRADEQYHCNTPEWWDRHHGVAKGEQFPWSGPKQKIIWKPDTYENLVEAWEENFGTT